MVIKTAKFVRGITGTDDILKDKKTHIAFVGRSNVGKSSLINSLTGFNKLAISSSTPGRTLQLNFFLINNKVYFVDFPGYGYSKISLKGAEKMRKMVMWYLEYSGIKPKVVLLIIDAKIGPTKFDLEMMELLTEQQNKIVVVANKIDKVKNSELVKQKKMITEKLDSENIIYYSSKTKQGREELLKAVLL